MARTEPNIYIFTGAGLSAPSGIETFRGTKGLWDNYDADQVCNYRNWKTNRSLVFQFYAERQKKYQLAKPNQAHHTISYLQQKYGKDRVKVITQNIDKLLEAAGCKEVLHLHGVIGQLHCTACDNVWESEIDPDVRCPKDRCRSRAVKPNVVFFHQPAPKYTEFRHYLRQLISKDIFIIIGTSGIVVDLDEITGKRSLGSRYSKYYQTNYFLNVFDSNHFNQIPEREDRYYKECCTEFLPKILEEIDEIMN